MPRNRQKIAAQAHARKTARADRHAETMRRHAEHRASIEAYYDDYDRWISDGEIGPRPIDPRY